MSLHVRIQILQVDLVVILVLKCMQAAVGALLKKELGEVAGRDEVIGLRVERRSTVLAIVTGLTLVET